MRQPYSSFSDIFPMVNTSYCFSEYMHTSLINYIYCSLYPPATNNNSILKAQESFTECRLHLADHSSTSKHHPHTQVRIIAIINGNLVSFQPQSLQQQEILGAHHVSQYSTPHCTNWYAVYAFSMRRRHYHD